MRLRLFCAEYKNFDVFLQIKIYEQVTSSSIPSEMKLRFVETWQAEDQILYRNKANAAEENNLVCVLFTMNDFKHGSCFSQMFFGLNNFATK